MGMYEREYLKWSVKGRELSGDIPADFMFDLEMVTGNFRQVVGQVVRRVYDYAEDYPDGDFSICVSSRECPMSGIFCYIRTLSNLTGDAGYGELAIVIADALLFAVTEIAVRNRHDEYYCSRYADAVASLSVEYLMLLDNVRKHSYSSWE